MPTHAEMKRWRALRRRKGRDATGCFLAEGPRLVGEVLDWSGDIVVVLHAEGATEDAAVRDLLDRALARGLRVESVPEVTIEALADAATPQPVIAIGRIPAYGWDDVRDGVILLLDRVQDPGNLGTLARTAVALGATGLVAVGESADPWAPKALRASAGAVFRGPVFRTDVEDAISRLRERAVPMWAASARGAPIAGPPIPSSVALALGSEAHGLSDELRGAADREVGVELEAGVESLNVAAAGAILLDRLRAGRVDDESVERGNA